MCDNIGFGSGVPDNAVRLEAGNVAVVTLGLLSFHSSSIGLNPNDHS